MPLLHKLSKGPYQVSRKKRTVKKNLKDIYGEGFQGKNVNLEAESKITDINEELTRDKIAIRQNIEIEYMMSKLVAKHGNNIQAMVKDKMNQLQYTEKKLETEYNKFMNLNQKVERKLTEKVLQNVILNEEEIDMPEIKTFQTMSVSYANRISQLQEFMQEKNNKK
ncbi:Ribosome_biogenesis protein Nop16 [Hexamita inflata]|uniref:Ribosome biogenesis protein Nop16 n=1 Tax=Hexamita inflata TaxID=28002 RepID=A0AA86P003_9EUKA|nr:Ribosome biogenesis protein Nop16 [Hexamita inflata]